MDLFSLDSQLQDESVFIKDLSLSRLLIKKDMENPWLILVPRKSNITEIIDLADLDQQQLMKEISLCSTILKNEFAAYKLNVAALGNVVRQLHIHVIARYMEDRAWPHPIWGSRSEKKWDEFQFQNWIQKIKENSAFSA